MDALDFFPYRFSHEHNLPAYLRVRAEGLPLRQAIWSGLAYLRKYRSAKWSTPPEALPYWADQTSLVRWLAQQSYPGLRLGLIGDIMWLRKGWQRFLSSEVLTYLNGHEVVLGNLETPISTRMPVPSLLPDYFTYNSDPHLITSFHRPDGSSTFRALAIANNHCLDRGDQGLGDTLDFLQSLDIPHSGVRASSREQPWVHFEAGGIRFGFYAACWGLNQPEALLRSRWHIETVPGLVPSVQFPVDLSRIRSVLQEMTRAGVEFRIVYLHWGYEFEFFPCPLLMQVAREIVRAGADLLAGSHPHVVQPMEVCFVNGYEQHLQSQGLQLPALLPQRGCLLQDESGLPRKALIVYSLGNFATAMFTLHCRTGLILSLHLHRDPSTGRIDWHQPEIQFVFNVPRDRASAERRVVLLESYLRECERHGDPATSLRQLATKLQTHLLGTEQALRSS